MKKVIAITCHQVTNPLIHTVNYFSLSGENTILIHVDRKANISDFEFLRKKNVILIEDRSNIKWGGFSQIKSTLSLMNHSKEYEYDYFFLLSGDDIPIKTETQLDTFLSENSGYNFIHYQDERTTYVDPHQRVKYRYTKHFFSRKKDIASRSIRLIHKITKNVLFKNKSYSKNLKNLPPMYKGTNWFGLTANSVEYILEFLSKSPWYTDIFKRSICADEVFFHTILKTSEENKSYANSDFPSNALRYIDWLRGPEYPRVLDSSDTDNIKNSNMFFARKISKDADPEFMMSFIK